jgi:hypothetical protein
MDAILAAAAARRHGACETAPCGLFDPFLYTARTRALLSDFLDRGCESRHGIEIQ